MLPLNRSFRRMLSKYVPELPAEKVTRFENLAALRHQVKQEFNLSRANRPERRATFNQATRELNSVMAPYQKQYTSVQKVYIARRKAALKQGGVQQFPSGWKELVEFTKVHVDFWRISVQVLPKLAWNRTGNCARIIIITCVGGGTGFFGFCMWLCQTHSELFYRWFFVCGCGQ